jgi:large repetitive protein
LARAVVMLGVLAMLWACGWTGSALAIFTNQATATANTVSAAAAFPRCYSDAVLADNPVSYWRLDETSGTTAADSKGSNPGTYTNGPTLGQAGALPDTINNKAASFDGVNDNVNVPYTAALNTAQFTLEFWAKPTGGAGTWRTPVNSWWERPQGVAPFKGFGIWATNGDAWDALAAYSSNYVEISGPPVVLNTWVHLVETFDGTTLRLYVNGAQAASGAVAGYTANTGAPLLIGVSDYGSGATEPYPGVVDDVAVYNSALTAAKIRTHYNTGRCYKDAVLADSPVGYWRLGETSGTTAADGIAGRHGSYIGAPSLNQTGALTGDTNPAVTFNGTSQYATVPYDAAFNPAQFSVEGWAKPTGGAGTFRTVATSWYELGGGASPRGYWLGVGTDDKWWLSIANGTTFTNIIGPTVTLSSWAHVLGTYDGTTGRLYVNGILVASTAVTYAANVSAPFGIGAYWANGSWIGLLPGSLDEVAVYNTALSQTRIQTHYLLGRSYQDTVLDSSPVSYWRLGEGSGTSAADAKGSNTGTYTGTPTLAQSGALAGDADTAVTFNGTSQYVTKAYTAALNPSQFSVEAWVMPTGGQGTDRAAAASWLDNSGSVSSGYWLGAATDNAWHFEIGTGGSPTLKEAVGSAITLNAWTHVVGTYDGTTARLYVNGALAGSVTTAYAANTSMGFYIAAEKTDSHSAVDEYFPARVDDVAVYNRALTATEVQLHYDSGRQ